MTSSVPYSFVPGTKAKAEEVNANFIAILDKIEQTNSDIENINQNLNSTKVNTDLSNLDETGQAVLDAKADAADLDGNWTQTSNLIAEHITFTQDYDNTFDLSSVLPDDDEVYEVLISALIRTGTAINNTIGLYVSSTLSGSIYLCRAVTRVSGYNQIASGSSIIPIADDRQIRFYAGSETNASSYANSCDFKISAYRKVR